MKDLLISLSAFAGLFSLCIILQARAYILNTAGHTVDFGIIKKHITAEENI